ncbi:diguanylate cyclase domain-containing protein [Acidovorax sp. LjRoot74]|uniref:diguanylate cyclase domain-containing protein n=1 Tax=Acidovorax sp. LjRoot74 TaxID=3342337 RepID=UPI003F5003B1
MCGEVHGEAGTWEWRLQAGFGAITRKCDSGDCELAVVYLNLDEFNRVNDDLGHSVGGEVRTIASQYMQSFLNDEDTLSSIGGDGVRCYQCCLIGGSVREPCAAH